MGWGREAVPHPHLQMVPVPWSECRSFYTPLLGRKGNTAPNEPSHKALSGTLVLLLSAWESLLSGKKRASLAQSCPAATAAVVCSPACDNCSVLPLCAHNPTHPPSSLPGKSGRTRTLQPATGSQGSSLLSSGPQKTGMSRHEPLSC